MGCMACIHTFPLKKLSIDTTYCMDKKQEVSMLLAPDADVSMVASI